MTGSVDTPCSKKLARQCARQRNCEFDKQAKKCRKTGTLEGKFCKLQPNETACEDSGRCLWDPNELNVTTETGTTGPTTVGTTSTSETIDIAVRGPRPASASATMTSTPVPGDETIDIAVRGRRPATPGASATMTSTPVPGGSPGGGGGAPGGGGGAPGGGGGSLGGSTGGGHTFSPPTTPNYGLPSPPSPTLCFHVTPPRHYL